jgi:hypothetical protein
MTDYQNQRENEVEVVPKSDEMTSSWKRVENIGLVNPTIVQEESTHGCTDWLRKLPRMYTERVWS